MSTRRSAHQVVGLEACLRHAPDAGHERRAGADDGDERDITMVIEPYFAKNASVRCRFSTLRKRYLPEKACGPIHLRRDS